MPEEQYAYDPVHNRIASAHQPGSWEYDSNNRLNAWGLGSQRTEYNYDDNGQTTRESRPGQITDYVYSAHERRVHPRFHGHLR